MGFHSPYFFVLVKVDRISIIGSNGNIKKASPVAFAADFVVDCDHYAGCDQSRENIDVP